MTPPNRDGTNRLRKSAFMKYQISLNNVVEFDPVFSLPQSMLRFIPLTANIFQVPKVPTRRYPQRDTTRFEHWPHLLLEPYFSTPTSVRPCSKTDFMQNSSEQRFKSEFYKFILFCWPSQLYSHKQFSYTGIGWIPRNIKTFIFKPKLSIHRENHKNDN